VIWMDKPLFFISLITAALTSPSPRKALGETAQQIALYCEEAPFAPGCAQFRQFMEEVTSQWDLRRQMPPEMVSSIAEDLALELSFGLFDGSEWEIKAARKLIESQESLHGTHLKLPIETHSSLKEQQQLKFIIKKEGIAIGSWQLGPSVQSIILPRIMPGTYTFGLNTGWRLLSVEFTDKDLIWSRAYPDQDLQMAADTGETGLTPSRIMRLWDGKMVIRVFPGIESGRIEIKIKDLC